MQETPLKEVIAKRIIELRVTHNLKQNELAGYLGWSNQNMQKAESGAQNIGTPKLKHICDYFNITLSDFFKSIDM